MWNTSSTRKVIIAAVAALLTGTTAANAVVYSGNLATGFGGPIGTGTITVTEPTAGTLLFSVAPNPPSSVGSNVLAIYIDSVAAVGVSSTAALSDTGDFGRSILTGNNSDVNFAAGFGADFGISYDPAGFNGVFDINDTIDDPAQVNSTSNFRFVTGESDDGAPYTVSITRAQLGLSPTAGFNFVGSYLSDSFYRSNETFGTSVTTPESGATPNAGFTGSVTFTNSLAYPAAVPEPVSVGLVGLAMAAAAMRRRRTV